MNTAKNLIITVIVRYIFCWRCFMYLFILLCYLLLPQSTVFTLNFFSFSSEEGGNVLSELHSVRDKCTHGSFGDFLLRRCVQRLRKHWTSCIEPFLKTHLLQLFRRILQGFVPVKLQRCFLYYETFQLSIVGGKSKFWVFFGWMFLLFLFHNCTGKSISIQGAPTLEPVVAYIYCDCVICPAALKL